MSSIQDVTKVLAKSQEWTLDQIPSVLEAYNGATALYSQSVDLEEQTKMFQILTEFALKLKPLMVQLVEKNAALKEALIQKEAAREVESLEDAAKLSALASKASALKDHRTALEKQKQSTVEELKQVKDKMREMGAKVQALADKFGVA